MRFTVLGPLRAWHDGVELRLGPPKLRAVLTLLLVQAGTPVPTHQLVDALWGEAPPPSARNVLHRHVGELRRLLEPELCSRADAQRLLRVGDGYRLDVRPDELDLLQFRTLRAHAKSLSDDESTREKALSLLVQALSLWNGRCAAGLPSALSAQPVIAAVNGEYVTAAKEAADVALAAGSGEKASTDVALAGGTGEKATADVALVAGSAEYVLATLRNAAGAEPYDEGLQARLMLVLSAAGHQAEALDHYQTVRARLSNELGLDPGPTLQDAQQQVLRQSDPAATTDAPRGTTPAPRTPPAQLPRDLDSFAGRHAELARMRKVLPAEGCAPGTVVISAIGGAPGVGKTALAVHWAHQVAERFPHGQLYVDLRGYDPSGAVLPPHEAIRCFLNALGVPGDDVPAEFDAQVGLYRSLLTHRRVLVVLDNARDAEQVRPLLPGAGGCLAVVTSRSQLLGLIASEGALSFRLDTLSEQESLELLAARLGEERVRQEPEAARAIAELCGYLPLTLAVVCARVGIHPESALSAFVDELRSSQGSLDAFATDDPATDARSVFSWSYRTLTDAGKRMFRLLALSPAPEVTRHSVAALAGIDQRDALVALGELTRTQLWRETVPGRFTAHDLIRAYGQELAVAEDPARERSLARRRMLDHYLHSAHAADTMLVPNRDRVIPPAADHDSCPIHFDRPDRARTWLITELPVMFAIVESDAGDERGGWYAWRLAAVLEQFLDRIGRRQEQLHVQRRGLAAAERLGDVAGQAHCHRALGFALGRVQQYAEAEVRLRRAQQLYAETSDLPGEARTCRYLAFLANARKEHRAALELYAHAEDLYARADRRVGSAAVANDVGWTRILLGEYEEALRDCSNAVRIAREVGDRNVEAAAWDSIGVARHHLGQQTEALEAYGRSLAQYRELGDAYLTADTLDHIGDAHRAADAPVEARAAWQEALAILAELGHPDAEVVRAKLTQKPARTGDG